MKVARVIKGWTQQQLADIAGLHLNTVSRIECGVVVPEPRTARLLAAKLGTTCADLFPDLAALDTHEGAAQ